MPAGAEVKIIKNRRPEDYHCTCKFCTGKALLGELRPNASEYYSRLERREYYATEETRREDGSGHIAKTPLHIARWAIQQFTDVGDWVLDPTIGAGTTAVEALTQGRHVAGMELEYGSVLQANIEKALRSEQAHDCQAQVAQGDARNIEAFLKTLDTKKVRRTFSLVQNNPPYSGDVSAYPKRNKDGTVKENASYLYNPDLPNLAFLKEGAEYWETLESIYASCIDRLNVGGRFVVGVKDMVKNKKPYLLHFEIAELLEDMGADMGLEFEGTALLRHYPGTWHLNRAMKENNTAVAQYQTITVFKKVR